VKDNFTNWIFSCDIKSYAVVEAFKKLQIIDWGTNKNVEKGDFIYIYLCAPIKKIVFKVQVIRDNVNNNELIDDSKFVLKEMNKSKENKYIRLQMIEDFSNSISNKLAYELLRENGLNGPIKGPLILNNNKKLFYYIDKIEEEQKNGICEKSEFEKIIELDNILSLSLSATEKNSIIKTRIGQGVFKKKLEEIECNCKVCGLKNRDLLIASHIKPWKDCNSIERLDDNNGFLLCPIHDALFDKGYISFEDNGKIIVSQLLDIDCYNLLSINGREQIKLTNKNRIYLKWHRENIFKG